MGQSFLYGLLAYKGVINELSSKQSISVGGFELNVSAMITVQKSAFKETPTMGAKLTVNGKLRRLVAIDEDSISYTFHLEDVNQ